MIGFKIITANGIEIRFECYTDTAPITSDAFFKILPFTKTFFHARISGQEIWIDDMPSLNIIQENASVFTEAGEAVLGPAFPVRSKTKNCFGIYDGEGKGLDACNIFAKVVHEDAEKLFNLGNEIWMKGAQEITVDIL